MKILKRCINQLNILRSEGITKEAIIQAFEKNPNQSIYVLDNEGKLSGIITLGSFGREKKNPNNWINVRFKSLFNSAREKEEAEDIFKGNKAIRTLPIVSKDNELLYEYYYMIENKKLSEQISMINEESIEEEIYPFSKFLLDSGYKKIIIFDKSNKFLEIYNYLVKCNNLDVYLMTDVNNRYKDINIISYEDIYSFQPNLILGIDENEVKIMKLKLDYMEKTQINSLLNLLNQRDFMVKYKDIVNYLKEKKIKFYVFELPIISKIINVSEIERDRIENRISIETLIMKVEENYEKLKKLVPDKYTVQEIKEIIDRPLTILRDNIKINADFESSLVNVIDGKRITTDTPNEYSNYIHIFGPCTVYGVYVEDQYTIPSYIQRLINMNNSINYKVVNHGVPGLERSFSQEYINSIELREGDIIIDIERISINTITNYKEYFEKINVPYTELSNVFDRPHNYGECFIEMPEHTTYIGNKLLSQKIYNVIQEEINNNSKGSIIRENNDNINRVFQDPNSSIENAQLKKYLEELHNLVNIQSAKLIGSIVMNCNPFTLGHRYLIEKALECVDHLIIFVVEENKSYFSFEDRIELVRRGTEDLINVTVIPSGKFIISTVTFPEYFNKDNLQNVSIDMSKDIRIFGKHIATTLNISKRFIGEEPIDYVTKQYNNSLKEILPLYNIEVFEIPRKEHNDQVISASKVRKYLEEKDFNKIKEIVPRSTYEFLKQRYK
ncbi:adenylyltransferase/cytidyltransferase family protein [Anaeromicropila herbilytica]|uniref:Citrate lyase ligase C-terminal domain-containing protein n=1 Tax=Anaeromicropila herbilytica TaxID=2785025 RepID=A0A7R7EPG7_9FIRM|nr:adenylyltransferase/cytidyltransferase family protein [Anaeromicropila herbilytica]BCN32519.1 hypothetical protein bsdtb5_38140 [Anaeromicropila herbilytica]